MGSSWAQTVACRVRWRVAWDCWEEGYWEQVQRDAERRPNLRSDGLQRAVAVGCAGGEVRSSSGPEVEVGAELFDADPVAVLGVVEAHAAA